MPEDEHDPHRFEFDLDRGIREQVVQALQKSPCLALAASVGPHESGIYGLYVRDRLVYVGKASKGTTKSKRTLRARLNEPCSTIHGRQDISCEFIKSGIQLGNRSRANRCS